jgi:mannan endo-1,4-beta-mannosidase
MEEFGYPRDGFKFTLDTPTKGRDGFYDYVFSLVGDNAEQGGYFAGCNFWGWGGLAKPAHEQWQPGDDYTNDPAQEAQGLNSVFAGDASTLAVIKHQVERMNKLTK